MSNREERNFKETINLFADKNFARNAWKSVGMAILQNPVNKPFVQCDKDGVELKTSELERYTYDQLSKDLREIFKEDRKPTELEMIMACQVKKARTDTAAATFVRDTVGAKPIDESKLDAIVQNPFEQLSDEELAIIARHREEVQDIKQDSSPEAASAESSHCDTADET